MTDSFLECWWQGQRRIGLQSAVRDGAIQLIEAPEGGVLSLFKSLGYNRARLSDAIFNATQPVTAVTADEITVLAPFLPPIDTHAVISGFGLSHRVKMPAGAQQLSLAEGGYPSWFFKGFAGTLRLDGESLSIPPDTVRVSEEVEVVLVYVIDSQSYPHYAGFTFGNDLTDMGKFRRNGSHLSYAKLCDGGISSRFFPAKAPAEVHGSVRIERDKATIWNGPFQTGIDALFYPLSDMMRQLWSHEALRVPGTVHYVFLGADRTSFDHGVHIEDGDHIRIDIESHDVSLTNTVLRRAPVLLET